MSAEFVSATAANTGCDMYMCNMVRDIIYFTSLERRTFLERHSFGTSQGEGKHNGQREAYSTSTTRHMRTSLTVTHLTHATTFWQHLVLPPPPCYGFSGP